MGNNPTASFWHALDKLVSGSRLVIDRPAGSRHPRFNDIVYPMDYGYLENTTSMDSNGIDVWRGTRPEQNVDAVIVTVDLYKRDPEIKLLIGCTQEEKTVILDFFNRSEYMKGLLIERDSD